MAIAIAARRWVALLAIFSFITLGGFSAYHVLTHAGDGGADEVSHWSLQDFRISIYYPVQTFLAGDNPYDIQRFRARYPQVAPFGLYCPTTLLLHLPFGLLSPRVADIADYLLNVALLPLLAYLALRLARVTPSVRRVFGIATLLLLSRAGQSALNLGQSTVYMVVALYAALHFARHRPWVAAIALAVISVKWTFAIPLALLMLCRGDVKALLRGAGVTAAALLAIVPWLLRAAGGIGPFTRAVVANYFDFRADANFDPVTSGGRVDAAGTIGRLARHSLTTPGDLVLMLAIVCVSGTVIRRLTRERSRERSDDVLVLTAALICVTALSAMYHQAYDVLVLTMPAVAVAAATWPAMPAMRWGVLALMVFPAFNYAASNTLMERLGIHGSAWVWIVSANGLAVLAAWAIHVAGARSIAGLAPRADATVLGGVAEAMAAAPE